MGGKQRIIHHSEWVANSESASRVCESKFAAGEKGMHPDTSVLDDGSGAITPGPVPRHANLWQICMHAEEPDTDRP